MGDTQSGSGGLSTPSTVGLPYGSSVLTFVGGMPTLQVAGVLTNQVNNTIGWNTDTKGGLFGSAMVSTFLPQALLGAYNGFALNGVKGITSGLGLQFGFKGVADKARLKMITKLGAEAGTKEGQKAIENAATRAKIGQGVNYAGMVAGMANNIFYGDTQYTKTEKNIDKVANLASTAGSIAGMAGYSVPGLNVALAAYQIGKLANNLAGKDADTLTYNKNVWAQAGGSYSGSQGTMQEAMGLQGKHFTAIGEGDRQAANALIHDAGRMQNYIGTISDLNIMDDQALANAGDMYDNRYLQFIQGMNYNLMRAAKSGMKIQQAKRIVSSMKIGNRFKLPIPETKLPEILEHIEIPLKKKEKFGGSSFNLSQDEEDYYDSDEYKSDLTYIGYDPETGKQLYRNIKDGTIQAYDHIIVFNKNGGQIEYTIEEIELPDIQKFAEGGQMSVIPEGALHARKHNIGHEEEITQKGIPVVTIEHGEMVLQAEIEKNEIIFNKETTDKIEELFKKFNEDGISQSEKDKLAIEAGKIITCEIMTNTDDRTGLIELVDA